MGNNISIEDSEEQSVDSEDYSDSELTKEGYLKDSFIEELTEELYD